MPDTEQQAVLFKSSEDRDSRGLLHITTFDRRDRLIRAAKVLALYWGLAIVSIAIPIAHFVLVPAFFIAGPIMAYSRYRAAAKSECATGTCPVCQREISIALESSDHPPLWKYCPLCNAPVHINQAGS